MVFVSDVSSCYPFLRVPRLVFFKGSCSLTFRDLSSSSDLALCLSLAFDHFLEFLLVISFLFLFSWLPKRVCVVNALVDEEIESHVWFEDRWTVTFWCDE
jgi:hypothetical protein